MNFQSLLSFECLTIKGHTSIGMSMTETFFVKKESINKAYIIRCIDADTDLLTMKELYMVCAWPFLNDVPQIFVRRQKI